MTLKELKKNTRINKKKTQPRDKHETGHNISYCSTILLTTHKIRDLKNEDTLA